MKICISKMIQIKEEPEEEPEEEPSEEPEQKYPVIEFATRDSDEESDDAEAEMYRNLTADQVMRARKYNECFICQKRFSNFSNFRSHVLTHGTTTYKCERCFKEFSTIKYLNAHLTTHNENRSFICDICSRNFVSKSSIRGHMRVHTGARPYKCDLCDKAFSESSTRRKHRFSHFPNNPYRKALDLYTCEICGKIVSYSRHSKVNCGQKNFHCQICSHSFASMYLLRSHYLIHESQS